MVTMVTGRFSDLAPAAVGATSIASTTTTASAHALPRNALILHPHGSRARHERADRQAAGALPVDRTQHLEIALDRPRLRSRDDHTPHHALHDMETHAADRDRGTDELLFAGAVEQDVGAEPA